MRIRPLLLLTAAAIAAITSACGGGDDHTDEPAPDSLIVYEARVGDAVNVFTIDAETGETTQITNGERFDGHPGWSPDRTSIIFASDRDVDGVREIYTMKRDGSDAHRISQADGTEKWSPKYSRDGQRIAFTSQHEADHYIAIMNADGSGARRLTESYEFAEFPAWSPDETEIWFSGSGPETQGIDLLAVNVETGDVRTVVSTPANDVCPHFTRDGKQVAYASAPGGDPELKQDIFLRDVTSTDTTGAGDIRLTEDPARDDYSNPSPDGSSWVFNSDRDGNGELYLMDLDGGNQRRLTNTPDARENVPTW